MDNDIRPSTKSIYNSRLTAFKLYCSDVGCNPQDAPVEVLANFLALLSDTMGYAYSTVSGYRSAISKFHNGIDNIPIGQNKIVKRLARATFLANPPLARYSDIWDVDIVMKYLETLEPLNTLSDFDLGLKTHALCALLSISRASSIVGLLPRFQVVGEEVVIPLATLEKSSRPGNDDGDDDDTLHDNQ